MMLDREIVVTEFDESRLPNLLDDDGDCVSATTRFNPAG
jgi:hypothetical protein